MGRTIVPPSYRPAPAWCRGRIPGAARLGRSIINAPLFLLACFGATRSPPGNAFVMIRER